ncbi:syntaxin 43 (macronuclear) [Tetrahymena thermophila SB210]|uniref:Syntaxin 43 n=1 Tax=Tetrahymena thermophila (strain SB210) TaxID=312017 RepID=Q245J8_TETTS|nr:syntaxin 43 [Tetrahymena thermophila SB210]EAS03634.3 syntaxin 43 [Tetrahymena thermophila SB210]|eukprot:XP_001023880.3 syntaxin 43 [Tetrahymena thermophila SB210]
MQVGGKPLGYWKNKTDILLQYKENTRQIQRKNRYQKEKFQKQSATQNNLFGSNSNISDLNSNGNKESLLIKDKFIEDKNAITIELKSNNLPPEWVDYYEICIQKLRQIESIQQQIAQKGRERLKRGFGDNSALDNQIYDLTREANQMIKECERKIQQIDEVAALKRESASEQQIRKNVKSSLAQQISDITIRLRKQQKAIYDTLKKNGNSTDDFGNTFMPFNDIESQKQSQVQDDIYEEIAKGREKDINQLVDQINELSDIYKTLHVLVIDQGTLLDRIDFNISETKNNVVKTNQQLKKALKHQESPFAQRVIHALIGFIVFFSLVLILKYTS